MFINNFFISDLKFKGNYNLTFVAIRRNHSESAKACESDGARLVDVKNRLLSEEIGTQVR